MTAFWDLLAEYFLLKTMKKQIL